MKTMTIERGIKFTPRLGVNRCPVCGWRFVLESDWDFEEMFCARCESRLRFEDDGRCRRWMAVGVYT